MNWTQTRKVDYRTRNARKCDQAHAAFMRLVYARRRNARRHRRSKHWERVGYKWSVRIIKNLIRGRHYADAAAYLRRELGVI